MNISSFKEIYLQNSILKQKNPSFKGVLFKEEELYTDYSDRREKFGYRYTYYPFNNESEREIKEIKEEHREIPGKKIHLRSTLDDHHKEVHIGKILDFSKKDAMNYLKYIRQNKRRDGFDCKQMAKIEQFEAELDYLKRRHNKKFEIII